MEDKESTPFTFDSLSGHLQSWEVLHQNFYRRDASEVAKDLLGKVLLHRERQGDTGGRIVETEAYYGADDPASRARKGKKRYNEVMWAEPGKIFVYMVHSHWLFNVVTGEDNEPSAVLVRALEPLLGIWEMKQRRGKDRVEALTSGPGKLTQALNINKRFHGTSVTDPEGELTIVDPGQGDMTIATSHRIGVREDLSEPLRFFVEDNPYVSK